MTPHNGPPANGGDPADDNRDDETHASLELAGSAVETEPPLLPPSGPLRPVFRAIGVLEQIVNSVLLVLILILVLAQVAQRYLPGAAPWTGELARLAMVWATFLIAGYLIAYAPHHIAIRIIEYVAKGRWLASVHFFVNVVVLATCVILLYGGYTLLATDIGQVTPAGEIPLRLVNAIPLVGLALVTIRVILGIVVRDVPALRGRGGEAT